MREQILRALNTPNYSIKKINICIIPLSVGLENDILWILSMSLKLEKYSETRNNDTSKEFIKCRILHFLIMECCRYLVF